MKNSASMNNKLKLSIFFLVFGIIILGYDIPLSEHKIIGTYVNNNYNERAFYAGIPYIKDTLKLNQDKTFVSKYYGNGTYELSSNFLESRLSISYDYQMGKAGAEFILKNRPFQSIKIILAYDLDYYYEKVL